MNILINQPHDSIMPIKFSPCATNPYVATEPWTCPNQAVHHYRPSRAPIRVVHNEYPSQASRTAEPHTRPCRASQTAGPCIHSNALGHAYARHVHSAVHMPYAQALGRAYARALIRIQPQSCPSHLEPSVLHTLRYEQHVLLLLIYL